MISFQNQIDWNEKEQWNSIETLNSQIFENVGLSSEYSKPLNF